MRKETRSSLKSIAVLYHADCTDGFGAAWSAWRAFKDKAVYIAVPPGNRVLPTVAHNKDLYTLDYSFPVDVIPSIRKQVRSLTIVDHHISNKESAALADESVFDLKHSGAVLAWKFFHPKKPTPRLLQHIEDYDIWKFRLRHTQELAEALSLYDMNFKTWDTLVRDSEGARIKKYIDEGNVLLRRMERRVGRLVNFGEEIVFEGHKALLVNTPFYVSEVGHAIAKKGIPVALMWSRRNEKIVISLRSDGSVNVAELAERYGGGGHAAAAGFTFVKKDFLKFKKNRLRAKKLVVKGV
jgi:uncharacterized protein